MKPLCALMAETNQNEIPPTSHPNGTLLIVRSLRKLFYQDGGIWTPARLPAG